jgi:hypothetical protein
MENRETPCCILMILSSLDHGLYGIIEMVSFFSNITGILKYVSVCPKVTSLRLFTERNPAYRRGMQDWLDLL